MNFEIINYCEIYPPAIKAYSLLHGVEEKLNLGDISKINPISIADFDLMTFGFPCQDITALGNQVGLFKDDGSLTRSGLFFEAIKIAKQKQPKFLFAENVRALTSKKFADDFKSMIKLIDDIGYKTYYKVLNSKDFGIPQSRNRVYIICIRKDIDVGFEFPTPIELNKKASDFYEFCEVDDCYYLRESDIKYLSEFRIKKKYSSLNADVIVCQTTKQGNLANPQNFIKDDKGYRVMTPTELLALQGFDRSYGELLLKSGISKEKCGFMSGNSITVDVLREIFKQLVLFYPNDFCDLKLVSLFSGIGAFEEALKTL